MARVNGESLFYKKLHEWFVGEEIEDPGYDNLIKVKTMYYNDVEKTIKKDIEEAIQKDPSIKEKIFDALHSFFGEYIKKEKECFVYSSGRDVVLLWKTRMFYYVKTVNKKTPAGSKKQEIDFFIHKNMKDFLLEKLKMWEYENFFKNDKKIDPEKTKLLKVVEEISVKIIDFVSQFEDELVKIWNKPKFVKNSNYVITLDRLEKFGEKGMEIIQKILSHKNIGKQIEEWKELGIIDNDFDVNKVLETSLSGICLSKKYKFLPIDTKYFKDLEIEILSLFDDLDNSLDGWLIKSENYQALNTLLPKFKEKVQTIYIDPPFNLESSDQFLYRTNYKDSTWATLLENRLRLARDWLNERGSIFVRCDYNGNWIVRCIMDEIFGKENFRNEIIISKGKRTESKERNKFENDTETVLFYASNKEKTLIKIPLKEKPKEELEWTTMFFPEERGDPYRIFYGIKIKAPKNTHWQFSQERINDEIKKGNIRIICNNCGYIHDRDNNISKCPKCNSLDFSAQYMRREIPVNNDWTDIPGYTYTISKSTGFPTENSEILLKRVIESTSNEGDLVMDFFLGSGTTVAVAHKLKRKWIGIEMGEHFYSIVLPRMKKVLAYDKSGISKEKDVKEKYNENNTGGFFKYYELEQYEETLANTVYENHGLFNFGNKTRYEQYVFIRDKKMSGTLEIDYKNRKVNVDLNKIYPNIDIAETISNLTGKWIKKIKENEAEFQDGSKINIKDLDYKIIKPLIWWE